MSNNCDIIWKKWWRNVNGIVSFQNGFSGKFDSDYWYFNIDPDSRLESVDDDDEDRVHVDDLFDTEADATEAAQEYCLEEQVILHKKMKELGIK